MAHSAFLLYWSRYTEHMSKLPITSTAKYSKPSQDKEIKVMCTFLHPSQSQWVFLTTDCREALKFVG